MEKHVPSVQHFDNFRERNFLNFTSIVISEANNIQITFPHTFNIKN